STSELPPPDSAGPPPLWPHDRSAVDRPPLTCGASKAHSSAKPAPGARCKAAPRCEDRWLRSLPEILSAPLRWPLRDPSPRASSARSALAARTWLPPAAPPIVPVLPFARPDPHPAPH